MTKPILVIGRPHSGKTTFIAQLYKRLDAGNSSLKLYKAVDNLSPILEAIERLSNGKEVKATPSDKNVSVILPIKVGNENIDLYCPDYGGEQVNSIIDNRAVHSKWSEPIKESNNWVLFIRQSNLTTGFDLSNKTVNRDELKKWAEDNQEFVISDQSALIELLQILLFIKEQNMHFKNSTTKLTIVLTCWDEVNTGELPKEKLKKCLPLLLDFIDANWTSDKISIVGLSSQGFSLKEPENEEKYQSEGPENFGFFVKPDGTEVNDITQLISEVL